MSYEQAVKHWKNHRKDRYYQQCSGYFGNNTPTSYSDDLEEKSFNWLVNRYKKQDNFPISIKQGAGGVWSTVALEDSFGTVVNSTEELKRLGEYLGYKI